MAYEFFQHQALAYAFNFVSLSVSYFNPYSKYIKPFVSLNFFFSIVSSMLDSLCASNTLPFLWLAQFYSVIW